jgi:hypothetical protein
MNAWNITSNWKNEKYLGMLKKNITPSEQIHKQMGTSPEKKIGCAYTWPSTLPDWYWYIEEENKVVGLDMFYEPKRPLSLKRVRVMVFNATFNNISVISWQSDFCGGNRSTRR